MSQQGINRNDIPGLIKEALVEQYGESQSRCVRGYVPSQSIKTVMKYLDPEQVQEVRGKRLVKDNTESFKMPAYDLPAYVDVEEQLKRKLKLRYNKAEHTRMDWDMLVDFLEDSELRDVAINKLVFTMENDDLRDHLFKLLQEAINYPDSYGSEFVNKFYFVMESQSPEQKKDYDNVDSAHDESYLQELGWSPRTIDLMGIWSHYAWVNSGNQPMVETGEQPMGVTQNEIEELAFNQRKSDEPVFGAVNSKLVVNRWRSPFGSGMTDIKPYKFEEKQGWVRSDA